MYHLSHRSILRQNHLVSASGTTQSVAYGCLWCRALLKMYGGRILRDPVVPLVATLFEIERGCHLQLSCLNMISFQATECPFSAIAIESIASAQAVTASRM
jgi:hypothetical protein